MRPSAKSNKINKVDIKRLLLLMSIPVFALAAIVFLASQKEKTPPAVKISLVPGNHDTHH